MKHSARAANIESEPQCQLHDDSIDIVWIPSQNMQFFERSNENPTTESSDLVALKHYFDTKFNALEAKITNNVQTVITELDEKFNSYIKTVAEDQRIQESQTRANSEAKANERSKCTILK